MAVESQVVVSPVPSASKSDEEARLEAAAEEFLAQVVDASGDYEYLPAPIDSVPADLFGGELGDYELHGELGRQILRILYVTVYHYVHYLDRTEQDICFCFMSLQSLYYY
jgi:hypothetical protein